MEIWAESPGGIKADFLGQVTKWESIVLSLRAVVVRMGIFFPMSPSLLRSDRVLLRPYTLIQSQESKRKLSKSYTGISRGISCQAPVPTYSKV